MNTSNHIIIEGIDASSTGTPDPFTLANYLLDRIRFLEDNNRFLSEELGRVERLAYYDELTGLENRHGLNRYIGNLVIRLTERADLSENLSDEYVGVVAIDANKLKITNDTHGHHAGDRLLEHLSGVLVGITRHQLGQSFEERRQLEEDDYFPDGVFRLGGDEFLIILYGLKKATLPELVQDLRELDFMRVRFENSDIDFSASYYTRIVPSAEVLCDTNILITAIDQADKSMMEIKASQNESSK